MDRRFTLRQAEALLPAVAEQMAQAVHLKDELQKTTSHIETVTHQVAMSGGMRLDRSEFLAHRGKQEAVAKRLRELIREIHDHGCQVKDLDNGLLDFPTWYRGEEVLLCWKLGEASIEYWHGAQEGFRGRRKIDQDFLENHSGDAAS